MKLELRYIGTTLLELTIESGSTTFTEDVTEWKSGKVDFLLIENLRDIADQLEEFNLNIDKKQLNDEQRRKTKRD